MRYNSSTGILRVTGKDTKLRTGIKDSSIIADVEVIEITADNGTIFAVLELETDYQSGAICVTVEGKGMIKIYQIK